jgi:hypothetical protein
VVYINGFEVKRDAMPGEPFDNSITWETRASDPGISGTDEFAFHKFSIGTERLIPGINVIAAEVHQVLPTSSDISFDLKLTGVRHVPGGVLTNDSDPDGASVPLSAVVVTQPTNGSVSMTANGHFTYTPTGNYSGPDTFTYKVNDGLSDSLPATVTINVTPINDPPVANAGGPYSVGAGSNLSLSGAASTDPDDSLAQLTFQWDLNYDGVSFDVDAIGVSPTVSFPAPFAARQIALRVTDSFGLQSTATTTLQVTSGSASVLARRLFYNESKFDGENPAAGAADDAAIATDKTALMPGQTASFANYSSYNRGLNGIMIDIAGLPPGALSASNFTFKVGNTSTSGTWTPLATAPNVTVRPGAGMNNSSRVTLIWPTGAAIRQWLQVTIAANGATGLAVPDVFYFGNAVAEAGNVSDDFSVSVTDELLARNNPVSVVPGAIITNRFDYNRDGTVSVIDQLLSRNNLTTTNIKLQQITVPGALQAGGLSAQGLSDGASGVSSQPALPSSSTLTVEKPADDAAVRLPSAKSAATHAAALDSLLVDASTADDRLPCSHASELSGELLELLARKN